jgi:hypothetical protein
MCPNGRRGRGKGIAAIVAPALAALLVSHAAAQTPTPKPKPGRQEESRRKLLEQIGLDKKEPAPPKPAEPAPPQPAAPDPESPPGRDAPPAGPSAPSRSGQVTTSVPFAGRVHESLLGACRPCHAAGGVAAATRLLLDGQPEHDHAATRRLVDLANPRGSLLLTKATGNQHGGGPTITTSSDIYRRVAQWIASGADLHARARPAASSSPATATAAPARRTRSPRARAAAPVAAPPSPPSPTPAIPPSGTPEPAPGTPNGQALPAPPSASPAATSATPALPASPGPASDSKDDGSPAASARTLHAELLKACLACHREGGPAGATRYKLSGELPADLAASRLFVDMVAPTESILLTKAAGKAHAGGAPWPPESAGQAAVIAWVTSGALDAAPAVADAPVDRAPSPPSKQAAAAASGAPPSPAAQGAAQAPASRAAARPHGLAFFGNTLTLNGRFDVNVERRGFEANPWGQGSVTGLQSYHHFLFLGRQSAEDPFTLTAELISLEFFEAGVRLGPRSRSWKIHLRAGKLLVPFGNEPLFHQSYGGHVGFDQRVLPPVWAAEGLAMAANVAVRSLTLSAELYGVRGHALRRADAVLNLQNDFSTVDDARPALGVRLGAAGGPLSSFYSAYFNPLGHDRRLFMQALDLTLWRWPDISVLDRLVLGAGLLRADVSGGGSGADYYHFASYWLARFYMLEGLYLQYRQGLRTFDNKRNLIYDGRRPSRDDGSTHNVSLSARYRGLSTSLTYFINLEKADEIDDDLLRLTVAYEF